VTYIREVRRKPSNPDYKGKKKECGKGNPSRRKKEQSSEKNKDLLWGDPIEKPDGGCGGLVFPRRRITLDKKRKVVSGNVEKKNHLQGRTSEESTKRGIGSVLKERKAGGLVEKKKNPTKRGGGHLVKPQIESETKDGADSFAIPSNRTEKASETESRGQKGQGGET